MNRQMRIGLVVIFVVLLSPTGFAQNLLKYRDFEFGTSVETVLKQTKMSAANAITTYAAPNLIQTIEWNKQGYFFSTDETDPVRAFRFDFYNNQLFKVTATYSTRQLEGMTTSDLIAAISKVYGPSSSPDETIVVSVNAGYEDRQKVLARWENGENTFSLFRSSTGGEFGLAASSKTLEGVAMLSIHDSQRLEALAAPQREIEQRQKAADERRAQEEKARLINMPNFQP